MIHLRTALLVIAITGSVGITAAGPAIGSERAGSPTRGDATCAPPNDHTGHACDEFNRMVRENFTRQEIALLFGFPTGSVAASNGVNERLQRRYRALLQQFESVRAAAASAAATER